MLRFEDTDYTFCPYERLKRSNGLHSRILRNGSPQPAIREIDCVDADQPAAGIGTLYSRQR
jgi:hypothetical protein